MDNENKITREIPRLSDAELHVYRYILGHAEDITHISIHDLATRTNTSTATVLRLCRKYGCAGFQEFKLRLQEQLLSARNNDISSIGNGRQDLSYFFNHTVLQESFKETIHKASVILASCSQIIFIGDGSSNIVSYYASMYFSYLCRYASRVEDINNYAMDYFFENLPANACLVILSVTGTNNHILKLLKRSHSDNLHIVVITDNNDSTLAKLGDVTISYNIPISKLKESNLTSQVPAVYIVEELARKTRELMEK